MASGGLGTLVYIAERPSRAAWWVGILAGTTYAIGVLVFLRHNRSGRLSARTSIEISAVGGSLGGLAFLLLDRSVLGYLAAMLLICAAVLLALAIGFGMAGGVRRSRLQGG